MILQVMRHPSLRSVPIVWLKPVSRLMQSNTLSLAGSAIETVSQWNLTVRERDVLLPVLKQAGNRDELSMVLKMAIIKSIGRFDPLLQDGPMKMTVVAYGDSSQPELREMALGIWREAELRSDQLSELLGLFADSGPLHLSQLIGLFHGQSKPDLGDALLQAVRKAPANGSIRPDLLLHAIDSFPEKIQDQARAWLKTRAVDIEKQREQLNQVLTQLPKGDVRRGQAVFKSEQTACSACHQIGYVGGQAGPDLSRIGSVRTERDLLEAILFPSASFVRSYEPMIVETHAGEEFSGVMHREVGM